MLSVSSNFTAAEKADANQIASRIYLVLGNYASAAAYGATVSASSTDGSGNFPAAGAIDGDRTELNVGAASGADNDIGLSSWRSSTAPSVTPQTLTVDMGVSRTINRIKLYHLASHGLKSYKLESSPDNSTWTLIAKTTDQSGTIATTNQLDTIDFSDVTCRYVRLTVADTVVGADKANVVEIEFYRKVDVTKRVTSAVINRQRDYKLLNPLAASFQIICDNSDRFFSFSRTPTTTEVASGFVNSELQPNIGIIIQYGFAYGGAPGELVTVYNGIVDRINIDPMNRIATIEGRDGMKPLINQIISSKLKTAQDIKSCIQYALNLANVSNWEMALDTTSLTIDYFYIVNQSLLTVIRDLVQASGDAAFFYDENGIATFKYYVNSTPQRHLDTTEADFEAGTVFTNIDTVSTPNQISRKWFLIDDFADNNFNLNPTWTNRNVMQNHVDSSKADFDAGTILTNVDTALNPGQIQRKWFVIDDFNDFSYFFNPLWSVFGGSPSYFTIVGDSFGGALQFDSSSFGFPPGTIATVNGAINPFMAKTGSWSWQIKFHSTASGSTTLVGFMCASPGSSEYGVGFGSGTALYIYKRVGGVVTPLSGGTVASLYDNAFHQFHVTVETPDNFTYTFKMYLDGVLIETTTDNINPAFNPAQFSLNVATAAGSGYVCRLDSIYYSYSVIAPETPTNAQAVFESQIVDQTTQLFAEGTLAFNGSTAPSGSSLTFYTATSSDGVTFDPYVALGAGGAIQSSVKRYIKYRAVMGAAIDSGSSNANLSTPTIQDVTITWATIGWRCNSNALQYAPGASNATAGIDLPFSSATGTWRATFKLTPGSGAGEKARMYFLTTGYDVTTGTYLSGYYVEVNQPDGKIYLYKIDSGGTRTQLGSATVTVDSNVHSIRATRVVTDIINVYYDEVAKINVIDSSYTATAALSFEIDPAGDLNGNTVIDDVYYSPQADGTGALTNVQSIYESQVIDMNGIVSLGIFQSTISTPTGTTLAFYTASSSDGVTFDAYVPAANGNQIASAIKRYLKYKVVFTGPIDSVVNGGLAQNANLLQPVVFDVTINWNTGTGNTKFPVNVSYTFRFDTTLINLSQEISDNLGGDSSIINDVYVQAKPVLLTGNDSDVQWQGTTQVPPVSISAGNPLAVTISQVLIYQLNLSQAMDISRMSGANPAAAAITFAGGGAGSWVFTSIHPTRPILKITITGTGNITGLQVQGKIFSNSNTVAQQNSQDATSIKLYGDRQISISNAYIVNTGQALTVASKLVSNYKNPTSYIPGAIVRPTFSAQLNDRVTIVDDNTSISGDYVIAGIQHQVASGLTNPNAETDLLLLKVT